MTFAALGIYLAWLVLAFGVPIAAARRRSGGRDSRIRLTGAQWWGEAAFGVVGVLGLVTPVLDLLGVVPRIGVLDHLPPRAVGALIALAGLASTLYPQLSMGAS